ncbi:hypothetical protein FVE85_6299 [Porphyridium purpureum]|uniref:Methyltransferase domain-containing protein n=1 Tax=Porphyridium purpureum TaxID=35688 RepID=A0A5J4Z6Q8_PORPP|nr:hypothetical protein FVE85_6299 [Porphyridium purpureum]|eukprot:POR6854..scf295_1
MRRCRLDVTLEEPERATMFIIGLDAGPDAQTSRRYQLDLHRSRCDVFALTKAVACRRTLVATVALSKRRASDHDQVKSKDADALEAFCAELHGALKRGTFARLIMSDPSPQANSEERCDAASTYSDPLVSVRGKLVELKSGVHLQLVMRYMTREEAENVPVDDDVLFASVHRVKELVVAFGFRQVNVMTQDADWQLRFKKKKTKSPVLIKSKPSMSASDIGAQSHNRTKIRILDQNESFLHELGVTNQLGKPRPGMNDKLVQIQRFVEIISHLVRDSPFFASNDDQSQKRGQEPGEKATNIRVTDFGCGKGHLTFAVHVFLSSLNQTTIRNVTTYGVELRPHLVERANDIARITGLAPALQFVSQSISDFQKRQREEKAAASYETDEVRVMIALHACDTASDEAIHSGIVESAALIVAAPCCHKECRKQMDETLATSVPGSLSEILPIAHHGIMLDRQATLVTDAIRARLLEMYGYKANVFEFVSNEHTGKNIMITAVKRDRHGPERSPSSVQIDELRRFCAFYGVREQRLAHLLGISLVP